MGFRSNIFQTFSNRAFDFCSASWRGKPCLGLMDPRKQPGWQRLAQPGESLGAYADGTPVWVYRGAGWSKGFVQSLTSKGGRHAVDRLVVRLADERGGHPYVVVYDTRNICRRDT